MRSARRALKQGMSRLKPPRTACALLAVDVDSGGSIVPRVSAGTSGPAAQKPEEIVPGQHAHGNSALDHGNVMQIPLHHPAYDGR